MRINSAIFNSAVDTTLVFLYLSIRIQVNNNECTVLSFVICFCRQIRNVEIYIYAKFFMSFKKAL